MTPRSSVAQVCPLTLINRLRRSGKPVPQSLVEAKRQYDKESKARLRLVRAAEKRAYGNIPAKAQLITSNHFEFSYRLSGRLYL